jgi:hypothetical protein
MPHGAWSDTKLRLRQGGNNAQKRQGSVLVWH